MGNRYDRRTFLKRVGSAAFAVPTVTMWACDREAALEERPLASVEPPPLTRPLLLPWSDTAIRVAAPLAELPMAYVSMGERRIYVEYDFRDRVYWALRAHISVSTGVWRIPLPGDPESIPFTPGDRLREFEEFAIRDWDPAVPPAEGDMRIRGGRPVDASFRFSCVPLAGAGEFYSAGAIRIERCQPSGEDACREDFMDVGSAERHFERACSEPTGVVGLMTWACR